ncbi:DUF6056 family protein [uncultured Catenibacterium sp.]|uniref:DUF6056 family protein n=1 Tax=uncultured Catenibacterium sp. TaxID=286142 RepID=UPI00262A0191|nr:DUF6056 family protein [uncultured Catenibacterium sp.]
MGILQNDEKLPGNKCKQINNIVMSVLFIVLQYAVSINIFLMGDDFMYAVFAREGCIKSAWNYYFTGNGRWILNILDSLILKFDRYAYVIILPWLMLLFAWLVYKLCIRITKKQSTYGFLVSLLIVSSIDISISRETIYWITGGLNYLFPAILFLAAADIILYLREEKKCVTWKKVIGGIFIIVSSTTMEQFGLMTFGCMTLLFAYDVYKKKKIEKSLILIYIMSLIGLATMLLAPGNFVRISDQAEAGQSLFIKLIDLFYMNYFSVQAAKFISVLTIIEGVILFKNKKYKIGIASLINAFLLFTSFILSWLPAKAKMPVAILSLFILCISTAYVVNVLNMKCDLYYVGFILLILLCGSQFMLLTGTLWGFRTSFSTITIYSIFTLIIFIAQEDTEIFYTVLCGIAFYSNWVLGVVVSLCILIIIFKKSNCQNQVVTILTCLVMCVSIIPIALGYYENRSVQEENVSNAIESQKNSDDMVEIYKYSDEIYGWTNPPYGEIHEHFFRKYYGIPESVKIVYKDNK